MKKILFDGETWIDTEVRYWWTQCRFCFLFYNTDDVEMHTGEYGMEYCPRCWNLINSPEVYIDGELQD